MANFVPLTQNNKEILKEIVFNINIKGCTCVKSALYLAKELLISREQINDITSIFLMSDNELFDTKNRNILQQGK